MNETTLPTKTHSISKNKAPNTRNSTEVCGCEYTAMLAASVGNGRMAKNKPASIHTKIATGTSMSTNNCPKFLYAKIAASFIKLKTLGNENAGVATDVDVETLAVVVSSIKNN